MIKLLIHNSITVVVGDDKIALSLIEDLCTLSYDYFYRRKGMSRAKKNFRELKYFKKDFPQFPTGWAGKIALNLRRHGIEFTVEDLRIQPQKIDLRILALPDDPWEHQDEALLAIQENGRGIVRVPTRGGKTLIMALSIAYFNVPTVVMVPNITLLEQEYEVFAEVFGEDKVGRLGGGHLGYDKDIIIASIQTLHSRSEDFFTRLCIFRRAGCVLFDECHHISHGGYKLRNTYFEVAQRYTAAYYRIGFTATPGKTTSLERQLLVGVAGKLIYSIGIDELTGRKILAPAQVHMVVIDLPHTQTLREILEGDHGITPELGVDIEVLYKQHQLPVPRIPTFQEQLRDKVSDNQAYQELIKFLAEYYADRGRSVLVSVSLVERGVGVWTQGSHQIKSAIGLSGKDNNRVETLNQFRNGEVKVLVSTLLREGIDLPRADVLILAPPDVQSATPVMQRVGRVLTSHTGKDSARIIDFYFKDQGVLERHSRSRMKLYGQNGFKIQILGAEDIQKMRHEEVV